MATLLRRAARPSAFTGICRHGTRSISTQFGFPTGYAPPQQQQQHAPRAAALPIPYVTETVGGGWKTSDIFSRLLQERIICLNGEVEESMSAMIVAQLLFLEADNPEKPISLYINSPGGSVSAGLAIYDTMNYIRCPVSTICMGQAASMGSLLLCGGQAGQRYILPHARVMIHQPSGGYSGKASDIADHAKEILRVRERLNKIYQGHLTKKRSLEEIEKFMVGDYFMDAQEAVEFGIVDKILERREDYRAKFLRTVPAMDIFIQHVPSGANHVQLRVFLKEKLARFDNLAFDVFKKHGNAWAIVTVAKEVNGNRFIQHYQTKEQLLYHGHQLRCKKSNDKSEALKVISLLEKEDEIRKKSQKPSPIKPKFSEPHYAFITMSSGVWNYDRAGKLLFEQKYQDPRSGTIIFGKTALVIYLESRMNAASRADWHCRIDIPYGILEHTIPSNESGQGFLMLTLKSPPKIYRIFSTDSLHLYRDTQSITMPQLQHLGAMFLQASLSSGRERSLHRLGTLQNHYDKSAALCMVYKVQFSNTQSMRYAWNFIRDFAAPGVDAWNTLILTVKTSSIEEDFKRYEQALAKWSGPNIDFDVAFQLTALVLKGTLSPVTMTNLIPGVHVLAGQHGSTKTAIGVRNLAHQIQTPAPNVDGGDYQIDTILSMIETNITESQTEFNNVMGNKKHDHLALIYKATVTPTGLLLRGPEWGVSNRVLRRYAKHTKHFMRVFFTDEDGLSVFHDSRSSQEEVYARFKEVLCNGITIAGRVFEFLGFSHASLRYHAAWFMAPFEENGSQVCAKDVIHALGDFKNIHCSAKCAARIGQAFSDTVHSVRVPDDADVIETKDDIIRNGRTFSDGCGTISRALLQKVWLSLPPNSRSKRPTVLQIRYRGAKGIVSLDSTLLGDQLHIRKSMTKYVAREGWRDLELCGAAYKPLNLFLNHQFIKILEDLNIPIKNLFAVQDDALKALELMVQHPLNAASFLGEVFVATQFPDEYGEWQHRALISDRVVVTQAPALHPGDIQLVKAVDVDSESELKALRNCIVFSQKGHRDLPSQLSGGDLDGDLFHIIYDDRLIPDFVYPPAEYESAPAKDLGRSVEASDIVDFFIDFMKMDRLGVISNKHKIRADRKIEGTRDAECIMLAKLASDAVDFSKSGNPADMSQIPPGRDHFKPDFMAPGHSFSINELGAAELNDIEDDDVDDPDTLSVLDPEKGRSRYYKSYKALGELYRRIDEKKFFTQMRDNFETAQTKFAWGGETLLQKLDHYIDRKAVGVQWTHHLEFAKNLREEYEDNMVDIMYSMRPHRGQPLTELEVFSGNILGKKERMATKHIREANKEVQERFDRDVSDMARRIARGDTNWEGADDVEALPRAIACFKVSLETKGWKNQVLLRSWKYVAAAVCLEQLSVYHHGLLRPL
ncbi:hypothetical protein E8E13_002785 [Curvularia kusanoi]|uniref:RNA-dependent RNA polymerase n=1 Tax=Curvularia kusanoi TaxID=90978 RepID=A0A9P4TGP8_CURKU|nr:hypothetical protein E8E13_002785 [Curvularia kusanoi]